MKNTVKGYRSRILHFVAEPSLGEANIDETNGGNSSGEKEKSYEYFDDGLLIVKNGIVQALGNYGDLGSKYTHIPITHYRDRLILPGFIDTHVHYPQTAIIGSASGPLLDWLETSVFPEEAKFSQSK